MYDTVHQLKTRVLELVPAQGKPEGEGWGSRVILSGIPGFEIRTYSHESKGLLA